ncbi:MAG: TM2 domain-containing protein [Bacteroidaceae bacterium]|nr:TM2 domain-containing protein [Bacteroidaceae bacterium]
MSEEREKRVQRFLVENKKYFPQNRMSDIKKKIEEISDEQFEQIEWLEFKDPSMMTIVAVFLGHIGVDRFMLDDVKNGILKLLCTLLTCGIAGTVWWFIDIFSISQRTTAYNYKKFADILTFI